MSSLNSTLRLDTFLPFLRDVGRCEQSLRELSLTWRMLEASARMNCAHEARDILPMMSATRQGFERLEGGLVSSLVEERVSTVLQTVGIKARHVVDIVVRNLFERTADVGFLATDRALCDFLAGEQDDGDADAVRARLRAYREKYTVYDNILLLDPAGQVRAQIDDQLPVRRSSDPLIAEALATNGFVETFRATDLRPGRRHALIYARRMQAADGRVVGVLCLSFDFEHEMAGIFRSRRDADERAVMLLLDGEDRVIASADESWLPVGTTVPVNHHDDARVLLHCGREYLVQTCRARGYQGYPGPAGWQGQVMIPIDIAFGGQRLLALAGLDAGTVQGLLTHARRFCPPLFEIIHAAQAIRRVVWNGQVMTARQGGDQQRLKTLLGQVSDAGARTNALFSQATRDLYDTVLGAALQRGEFVTRLQVDLLDRNLYERSDDCRWWALTSELRQALACPGEPGSPDRAAIGEVLQAINALYTVYTRLVVYDAQGCIVAASHPHLPNGASVLGTAIDPAALAAVLRLDVPQRYHVSPFEPSPLYDDRPTYVFHAAIRHPLNDRQVVGGIGIVFDAEREFAAMLRDALQGQAPHSTAMFVSRSGQVLSSLDPACPVGSQMDLPAELRTLPSDRSATRIVTHRGQYAVLACSVSHGYREFKVSDGYKEEVLALMFEPLGEVVEQAAALGEPTPCEAAALGEAVNGEQFATVSIDGQLHALPAAHVLEALPGEGIWPVSSGRTPHRLGALAMGGPGRPVRYVWAYDLLGLLRGAPTRDLTGLQVVVVQVAGVEMGLLVNGLQGAPEFEPRQIQPLPPTSTRGFVSALIALDDGQTLIPVLDLPALVAQWGVPATGEPASAVLPEANALPRLASDLVATG